MREKNGEWQRLLLVFLCLITLTAVYWLVTACSHPSQGSLPTASGLGPKPTPSETPVSTATRYLVYDGEGSPGINLAGLSYAFIMGGPACACNDVTSPVHMGTQAMQVDFDTSTGPAELQFNGFASTCVPPASVGGSLNFNYHNYIDFWVKGKNGGEKFSMRLNDKTVGNQSVYVSVTGSMFLPPSGGITTAWQRVLVPIAPFASVPVLDNSQIGRVKFHASQDETIYIDDWWIK